MLPTTPETPSLSPAGFPAFSLCSKAILDSETPSEIPLLPGWAQWLPPLQGPTLLLCGTCDLSHLLWYHACFYSKWGSLLCHFLSCDFIKDKTFGIYLYIPFVLPIECRGSGWHSRTVFNKWITNHSTYRVFIKILVKVKYTFLSAKECANGPSFAVHVYKEINIGSCTEETKLGLAFVLPAATLSIKLLFPHRRNELELCHGKHCVSCKPS